MTKSKRKSGSPSVSVREWAVAAFGSATLAFTAWGFGGVIAWSLHVMLIGGLLTFLCAVCPMPSKFNGTDGEHGNWNNLKRLLKLPIFWLSTAFLIYITIQAFNPGIEVVRDERGWWVERIEPPLASWLPTSVRSDYEPMNAFRVINLFLASFSLVCGLWAGLRRRKTTLCVLWIFILSGAGMGFVGMLQHFTGTEKVLWLIPSSNPHFWGSFFYRNQGAAYLNLVLLASGFLYFYYAKRTRDLGQSGGPHFLLFLFVVLIASSVALALSRGGIIFCSVLLLAFFILVIVQYISSIFQIGVSIGLSGLLFALILMGGYFSYKTVDWELIAERFDGIEESIESSGQDPRAISSRATWDMAQDRLILGWGAGSFRYIFPIYQQNYPEIFYRFYHKKKEQWVGRKVYRYAHNDIFQFLAEYGLLGCGLLGLMICCCAFYISAHFAKLMEGCVFVLVGFGAAFVHAFFDFIFNSPAYWISFAGLCVLATKLLHVGYRKREQFILL